jgi:hypothetical protein
VQTLKKVCQLSSWRPSARLFSLKEAKARSLLMGQQLLQGDRVAVRIAKVPVRLAVGLSMPLDTAEISVPKSNASCMERCGRLKRTPEQRGPAVVKIGGLLWTCYQSPRVLGYLLPCHSFEPVHYPVLIVCQSLLDDKTPRSIG